MIKSMTGYGKAEGGGFAVELRSVNHKFLDLSLKLPRGLLPLENRLKRALSERFFRGRMDVYITRGGGEEAPRALRLDLDAAKQYIGLLNELRNTFNLPGGIDLEMVAASKDIIVQVEESEDLEAAWAALQGPLCASMDALDRMRAEEGAALAADIRERAGSISGILEQVEGRSPLVVKEYARKLSERVSRLAEGVQLDPERLHMEVALFADRCDITEEVVRGRSHLVQLTAMLEQGGAVGRKIDFLLQEINREVNTIGSKASDKEIAHQVVEMKSELEKIREQVQNIE